MVINYFGFIFFSGIQGMSDWTKTKKDIENKELEKMSENASQFLGGVLGDISSKSAYTQILIGAVTGW